MSIPHASPDPRDTVLVRDGDPVGRETYFLLTVLGPSTSSSEQIGHTARRVGRRARDSRTTSSLLRARRGGTVGKGFGMEPLGISLPIVPMRKGDDRPGIGFLLAQRGGYSEFRNPPE